MLALYSTWSIRPIRPASAARPTNPNQQALNVLVFSQERWRQDVDILSDIPGIRLLEMPTRTVELLNAILQPAKTRKRYAAGEYFLETDTEILADRDLHAARVVRVLRWIRCWNRLDCAITGAFKYVREVPFARASVYIGLPFVALHKEFTVLETQHVGQRIQESRALGFRFFGSHLAVVSDTAKSLMSGAGIFPVSKITTIGLMRADKLHRQSAASPALAPAERPTVVLFSFGTLTGPFKNPLPPLRSYYFSADGAIGFTELFRDVHGGFAELALKHPEADFLIKPKNVEDWWICEIDAAATEITGRRLADIPNLRVVATPAPELMRRSCANIVLNSTTVIESRILGRNTIMPVFAEAAGRHADMVYFRDFLDLFTIAGSKQQLQDFLEQALAGARFEQGTPQRLSAFLSQQIGNPDGRAAARFAELLHQLSHLQSGKTAPATMLDSQKTA